MSLSTGLTTIVDGSSIHQVDLLGPRPAGHVRQAVVLLQAFDELTDRPIRVSPAVSTPAPGLAGRTATDGVAGLVGVPSRAFPQLETTGYPVEVDVHADGYLPWSDTVTIPVQAGFPTSFAGVDLGRIDLHRTGVVVEVRTFRLTAQGATVAAGGVDVRISAVWRTVTALAQPGQPPRFVGMPLGTSQPWPTGTALDSVSLVPVAEPSRTLACSAAPGDRTLAVDRVGGLVAGDLVGIDLADPDRREYLAAVSVGAGGDPGSPARLDLGGPVRIAHATGVPVRRVATPAPSPADTTTTDPAQAGDRTVFVATTAPFASVEIVRATGGAIADEYLDSHLYRATSNTDGLARLAPISRVAAVEITATQGALSATTRLTPYYLEPVNTVALTLH